MKSRSDLPALIGFAGPAGCGKSAAAGILGSAGFQRIRFAGPIKAMLRSLIYEALDTDDPELVEMMVDGALKELPTDLLGGKSPRFCLQTIGAEWGRDLVHPDFWCRIGMARAARFRAAGLPVVIDDVRFPNEAEAVHAAGGMIIRLAGRDGPDVGSHVSERLSFPAAQLVMNDGNLDVLRARLAAIPGLEKLHN